MVLDRKGNFNNAARNAMQLVDFGADIDDEIMFKFTPAHEFAEVHVCIVDGVEAKAGTPSDALARWTKFQELFSEEDIPDNVFFHTSHTICDYVAKNKITCFSDLIWCAPIHQDVDMFPLFDMVTFGSMTMQGNEDSFNMGASVQKEIATQQQNYELLCSKIKTLLPKMNKIPTSVCRQVCFTPKIVQKLREISPAFADEIERGAATMFFGRMPAHLARAASVLLMNLVTAEGYVASQTAELEAFLITAAHQAFMDANKQAIDEYLADLNQHSGSGDMDNLTHALQKIMNIVSYITNGNLRYDGSLSKVSPDSFGTAFESWREKKGDAVLTPAYDLLALGVAMNPEWMAMVHAKDTDGLTAALEAYVLALA